MLAFALIFLQTAHATPPDLPWYQHVQNKEDAACAVIPNSPNE
jgi:hypothetical protein